MDTDTIDINKELQSALPAVLAQMREPKGPHTMAASSA